MSETLTLIEQIEKGAKAESLNNVAEAFLEELKADAQALIEESEGADREGRENAYFMIRAINELRSKLTTAISISRGAHIELSKQLDEEEDAS